MEAFRLQEFGHCLHVLGTVLFFRTAQMECLAIFGVTDPGGYINAPGLQVYIHLHLFAKKEEKKSFVRILIFSDHCLDAHKISLALHHSTELLLSVLAVSLFY